MRRPLRQHTIRAARASMPRQTHALLRHCGRVCTAREVRASFKQRDARMAARVADADATFSFSVDFFSADASLTIRWHDDCDVSFISLLFASFVFYGLLHKFAPGAA